MDRNELLRRINTFPIVAEDLAKDMLAGDFRSVFRGQGIEFDEVRIYEQGDDIRSIDRNVSARFGKPYIKLYREERELTVFIVLDCSASMFAGSETLAVLSRYDQAVLASSLIAFSAERSGQRLGALLFDYEIRRVFKPRKGRPHVLSFTSAALEEKPGGPGSNLAAALAGVGKLLKKHSIIVIISDFLSTNWEPELGKLSEKHDCIACRIFDPIDTEFPNAGLVTVEDPESGKLAAFDSGSGIFRGAWAKWNADRAAFWASACKRSRAAHFELSTTEDAVEVIKRFFHARRRLHR